jgi:hypothetical protein
MDLVFDPQFAIAFVIFVAAGVLWIFIKGREGAK